jgi:hypothetical protein
MPAQTKAELPARPVIGQNQAYAGKVDAKSANNANKVKLGQHHFFIFP